VRLEHVRLYRWLERPELLDGAELPQQLQRKRPLFQRNLYLQSCLDRRELRDLGLPDQLQRSRHLRRGGGVRVRPGVGRHRLLDGLDADADTDSDAGVPQQLQR